MPLSEGTTELGSCIARIIHGDDTLTKIIVRPTCLIACSDYEPNVRVSDSLDGLHLQVCGSTEWFGILGVKFAGLTNLTQLTFDGLNPDDEDLERFWGEISGSRSLTSLYYTNMNLESCEEMLAAVHAPNLASITFQGCTIPNDIGYVLGQQIQEEVYMYNCLTTLRFIDCSFSDTNTMREIVVFATELAHITSITSFWFTSCSLNTEQSMCLVQCLREERRSRDVVQIHIGHWTIKCAWTDVCVMGVHVYWVLFCPYMGVQVYWVYKNINVLAISPPSCPKLLRPWKNKCKVPKLLRPRNNKCRVVWLSHLSLAQNYYDLEKINVKCQKLLWPRKYKYRVVWPSHLRLAQNFYDLEKKIL